MEKTAILIPAFNAAETLSELVHRLCPYVELQDIIVVDDGSTDHTLEVTKRIGVMTLPHARNYGKGRALRTGFEYILSSTQHEAVLTMDADLQHKPDDVPSFFSTRERMLTDMIIGYRKRWRTNMPFARKLSNSITSGLIAARTGRDIKDSQCGFRLLSRRLLETVTTTADGYEAETEQLIKAALSGFNIEFVPIQTVYENERSHITHVATTLRFLHTLLKDY
ncbi:MAG TPA: glycosyltransferase family 2 protein [Bacteroidota bacterium]